jgi:hypothetical protein
MGDEFAGQRPARGESEHLPYFEAETVGLAAM